MIYQTNKVVSKEFYKDLKEQGVPPDEFFIKRLAHDMIEGMSLESVEKIFVVEIINPDSKEAKALLENKDTPDHKKQEILNLKFDRMLKYRLTKEII